MRRWVAAALIGLAVATGTTAEDAQLEASWKQFTDELAAVGQRMQARLPPRLAGDPQVQQEAGRVILEAMAREVIAAIGADAAHPTFLPSLGAVMNIFQPNADTIYWNADVSDTGVYRLRGTAGNVRIAKLGQFRPLHSEVAFEDGPSSLQALDYRDFKELQVDANSRFDVLLSRERPAGYRGDWWQLKPGTGFLLLRQMASDWARERDWRVAIERLDTPVQRPRTSARELEDRLAGLAPRIGDVALSLVTHVEDMREAGYINRLNIMHTPGSLEGQFYYEGAFEITPDEALIIAAKVPDTCLYWSTLLTNDLYETIDWVNNHSSLNDAQARVDDDGIVRFVLSLRDPGVPNWLDPAGHTTGALQGRWTDCSSTPIPTITKVPFADLRGALPADTPTVTPAEREAVIRERRINFQLRPVW